MDDTTFSDSFRARLAEGTGNDISEPTAGCLQVRAGAVPRVSALLIDTLIDSPTLLKRVLAADLTTDPGLLAHRTEYLAANTRLLQAGGTIDRLFIAFAADLVRADYAQDLLGIVDHHRSLGVTCGLAVRDHLTEKQATDFVVISSAAVLVEEEQGDADYSKGRSLVYFADSADWIAEFDAMWNRGSESAPTTLQAYEALARPMLEQGAQWDADRLSAVTAP